MDRKRFRAILEEVLLDNYLDNNIEGVSDEIMDRLNEEFSMFDEDEDAEEEEF